MHSAFIKSFSSLFVNMTKIKLWKRQLKISLMDLVMQVYMHLISSPHLLTHAIRVQNFTVHIKY